MGLISIARDAAAATEIARRAGRSFPTDRRRIIEATAGGFMMLHKPVEADELRRALMSLLRGNGGTDTPRLAD